MRKIKIEVTAEEKAILNYEKNLGENKTIRKRAEILYYAAKGAESVTQMCRDLGRYEQLISNTLKGYEEYGIEYIYRCRRSKGA